MAALFEEADLFSAAGMLTGYWGASDELRKVLRNDYLEQYRGKEYYELVKDLRGAIVQWGQATTSMQFLDEYKMDFLKHRRAVETVTDVSEEQLRENAHFCLRFVTNLILKWQGEGILCPECSRPE